VTGAPGDLSVERHRDLRGRGVHPWVRRGLLALVLALPVAALFNVFGQHPSTATADGPDASLTVSAPSAARGGDQFTARLVVRAHRPLKQATLVLAPGWFEQVTLNGQAPQASNETSRNGAVAFEFGALGAGQKLTVWFAFQINPTDVARRDETVALADGRQQLVQVHHAITIFP
jgi:hypothetical protein